MTVDELIEKLRELPGDAPVVKWFDMSDGMGDSYNHYEDVHSVGVYSDLEYREGTHVVLF